MTRLATRLAVLEVVLFLMGSFVAALIVLTIAVAR
jgi:hypothetical protein